MDYGYSGDLIETWSITLCILFNKAYCWSTEEDILIRVKRCIGKSALNAVETPVASEGIVGPCRETGDWLKALQ